VGHETDFTIADFVADVRAATPSMAAELAVPVIADIKKNLDATVSRLAAGLKQGNRLRRSELNRICASALFKDPAGILIEDRRELLNAYAERTTAALENNLYKLRAGLERCNAKLEGLNPEAVLERGYACVSSAGAIVSGSEELTTGQLVEIRFHDGCAQAEILNTHRR